MADTKITALTALTAADPANDVIPIVDVSDTSMAASGTTKKISVNNILSSSPTASGALTVTGLVTAGSATITGALGAAGLNVTGATIPANGVYLGSANNLSFSAASTLGMTLNSTGLGVGGSVIDKFTVVGNSFLRGAAAGVRIGDGGGYGFISAYDQTLSTSKDLVLQTGGGNVGIGVTPSAWASYKALQVGSIGSLSSATGATIVGNNWFYDGASKYITTATSTIYEQGAGTHSWYSAASGTAGTAITFTQAMTLDGSGNLFIGKTATGLGTVGIQASPSGWFQATVSGDASLFTNRLASDGKTVQLYRQTLEVGNISVTTTGATFNSTSDYRLKEAVAPLSGGLARVNALKPSVYKWKSNGLSGEGFLAHELAEVVPAAVNGEKDAVNEDGSINAQSIDMSRVVPILVAAIQELTARVQTLETR